ncbi:ArnT family glycosyltransferase [Luteimonas sp. A478]
MMQSAAPSRILPVAALVALIFLIKFVAYAWLVTPLWDIPDESGHYSYVEDITQGTWPVIGEARMSKDVTKSWKGSHAKPGMNWIAQHPPMFYVAEAPVVLAAQAAGFDFEQRVRSARMLGGLFGALTILGLALFLARATGRDELGLAGAIFLAATPMFTHLSTGVSHDTMVACTAAWGAYWCVQWLHEDKFRHLLYAGALIALCTVTKLTALAMAVPLFFALAWRLWRQRKTLGRHQWLYRTVVLWLVMFTPICLWVVHNLTTVGQIFPDTGEIYDRNLVPIGFFELMLNFPFWQHTLLHLIALVGWNGSENGALKWIQANGLMARYFLAFFGVTALAILVKPFVSWLGSPWKSAAIGLALALIAWACWTLPLTQLAGWLCLLLFAALVFTAVSNGRRFIAADGMGWLLATSALCVLFFAFVYYEHLWAIFAGTLRATHGRYLYPVMPFLLLALLWPFRKRLASQVILGGAVIAMLFADGFYLRQVFALYGQL